MVRLATRTTRIGPFNAGPLFPSYSLSSGEARGKSLRSGNPVQASPAETQVVSIPHPHLPGVLGELLETFGVPCCASSHWPGARNAARKDTGACNDDSHTGGGPGSQEGPRLPALDSREIVLLFLHSGGVGVACPLPRQRRSEAPSDPHIPYSPCLGGLRSPASSLPPFSFLCLAPFPLSSPRPPAVFSSLPPIPSTSQASFPS